MTSRTPFSVFPISRRVLLVAVLGPVGLATALGGCAAVRQFAALTRVGFEYDRVTDVRLAGVALTGKGAYEDFGVTDLARVAAAVATGKVPLECTVHLTATNPASNSVTARLTALDWTFFLDGRQLVTGKLDQGYSFEPGKPVDVPVAVGFDAYQAVTHDVRGLVELGLAVAGVQGYEKEIRLDLRPTVQTDLGPITYPDAITVRRTVGGSSD